MYILCMVKMYVDVRIYNYVCMCVCMFQVVVTGLLSSIKSIGRILLINVLVMSIFAVIGTILFRVRVCMCYY